jgi:hypothetical protein
VVVFALVPKPGAAAVTLGSLAEPLGGYAAHALLNPAGNWLLDRVDQFPSASLSSLSVVTMSFLIASGTSVAVYGVGEASEDGSASLGSTILGGVAAVGLGALLGAVISQDDPLAGAAVGSVLGRYLAPLAATGAYALSKKDDQRLEIRIPAVRMAF